LGWGRQPLGFSLDPLVQKNVTLQGSFSHNWPIWERVIALLASGQLDVKPIIGGVWPITEWQEAFAKMHHGEVVKERLKTCLIMQLENKVVIVTGQYDRHW
jgi:alcohol dehydrogenase/L-iditol 2-dehydrogenase